MSAAEARIEITFTAPWCAGTGGGRGRHLDAVCLRDAEGFPAMDMTEVKGTLRESAELLAETGSGGWTHDHVALLFGGRSEDGDAGQPAALEFVGQARMVESQRRAAASTRARAALFRRIPATAINDNGVAQNRTLRYLEGAAPVTLCGLIQRTGALPSDLDWPALLDIAAAATPAFGKAKNNGFGRALARVGKADPATDTKEALRATGSLDDLAKARRVWLLLRPTRPAIFSLRSATEAGHRTLDAPSGAALLGWCAAHGPYEDFTDPFVVFHSGAVRFGNARPLSAGGIVAIPQPRNLFAPKGQSGVDSEGYLSVATVSVGMPDAKDHDIQYEVLRKPFLAWDERYGKWRVIELGKGQRLRTATKAGRAARNQLFGYQYLEASEDIWFAAELSRDTSVTDADWQRLLNSLNGLALSLGRAKHTGYGGGFECTLVAAKAPKSETARLSRIRVLALSDLALVDDWGAPTCHPTPAMFGLPEGLRFDALDSAISQRRHAPWNAHLGVRDRERAVIEAGSVLSFATISGEVEITRMHRHIGIWQEVGYGHVHIAPKYLDGEHFDADPDALTLDLPEVSDEKLGPEAGVPVDSGFRSWLEARFADDAREVAQ